MVWQAIGLGLLGSVIGKAIGGRSSSSPAPSPVQSFVGNLGTGIGAGITEGVVHGLTTRAAQAAGPKPQYLPQGYYPVPIIQSAAGTLAGQSPIQIYNTSTQGHPANFQGKLTESQIDVNQGQINRWSYLNTSDAEKQAIWERMNELATRRENLEYKHKVIQTDIYRETLRRLKTPMFQQALEHLVGRETLNSIKNKAGDIAALITQFAESHIPMNRQFAEDLLRIHVTPRKGY